MPGVEESGRQRAEWMKRGFTEANEEGRGDLRDLKEPGEWPRESTEIEGIGKASRYGI